MSDSKSPLGELTPAQREALLAWITDFAVCASGSMSLEDALAFTVEDVILHEINKPQSEDLKVAIKWLADKIFQAPTHTPVVLEMTNRFDSPIYPPATMIEQFTHMDRFFDNGD